MGNLSFRIYTTDYCSYCRAAKQLFDRHGLAYEEIDVSGDDAARIELRARAGRNTVPQIWYGDEHVGGYDDLVVWLGRHPELKRTGA
jgi:glutaredoxin 3